MSARIAVLQQGCPVEEGDAGVMTEQPTHPNTRAIPRAGRRERSRRPATGENTRQLAR
jgi:ABC-type dipeptide/oligopeptide/nickel transport system ATPase component